MRSEICEEVSLGSSATVMIVRLLSLRGQGCQSIFSGYKTSHMKHCRIFPFLRFPETDTGKRSFGRREMMGRLLSTCSLISDCFCVGEIMGPDSASICSVGDGSGADVERPVDVDLSVGSFLHLDLASFRSCMLLFSD